MKTVTAEKLAPLHDSDHDVVFIPSVDFSPDQAEKIPYRKVNRTTRENISRDIAMIEWSYITNLSDPNIKAEALQRSITDIVDKNCPIQYKHQPKINAMV